MIDNYVNMGFEIERVVQVFREVNIPTAGGIWQPLPEQFHSFVTARLLGE
jgi:hypothetical protein